MADSDIEFSSEVEWLFSVLGRETFCDSHEILQEVEETMSGEKIHEQIQEMEQAPLFTETFNAKATRTNEIKAIKTEPMTLGMYGSQYLTYEKKAHNTSNSLSYVDRNTRQSKRFVGNDASFDNDASLPIVPRRDEKSCEGPFASQQFEKQIELFNQIRCAQTRHLSQFNSPESSAVTEKSVPTMTFADTLQKQDTMIAPRQSWTSNHSLLRDHRAVKHLASAPTHSPNSSDQRSPSSSPSQFLKSASQAIAQSLRSSKTRKARKPPPRVANQHSQSIAVDRAQQPQFYPPLGNMLTRNEELYVAKEPDISYYQQVHGRLPGNSQDEVRQRMDAKTWLKSAPPEHKSGIANRRQWASKFRSGQACGGNRKRDGQSKVVKSVSKKQKKKSLGSAR